MGRIDLPVQLRRLLDLARSPAPWLAIAGVALVLVWVLETWWIAALLYGIGLAGLVAVEKGDLERTLGIAALASWAAAVTLWVAADSAVIVSDRTVMETALPFAVVASAVPFSLAVDRVLVRTDAGAARTPLVPAGLFVLGGLARLAELQTIVDQGDIGLFSVVLRNDIAGVVWAIAATLVALNVVYTWLSERAIEWTPELKKTVAVLVVGFMVLTHVGFTVGHVVATTGDRAPIQVGVHANDVAAVPEGLPSMHLEVQWSRVQPNATTWNWSYYDAQFDAADRRGLDVLLLVGLAPPQWLVDAHRDAVMVDQDGDVFHWIDEAPDKPRTRIHDLSYVDPEVDEARHEFVRRVVQRYAARPSVVGVSVMNEPAYPADFNPFRLGSYDNATVDAFRAHLQDLFGNVSRLNRTMGTDFANWSTVEPPRGLAGAYGRLWQRFREQSLVRHVAETMDVARRWTDKPVTVKIMEHYLVRFAKPQTALTGGVVEALVGMSDVVAVDLYPLTRSDLRRSLVYYEGLAAGKPVWVAEFNYAAGPNLPTMGARTYSTLSLLGKHADRVFFFTAEEHYLYGLDRYQSRPSLTAIQLYDTAPWTGEFAALTGQLVLHELMSVVNLYLVYATASAFFGFPVAPWLVLLVLAVPIPKVGPYERRHRVAGRLLAAAGIWVLLWFARTFIL